MKKVRVITVAILVCALLAALTFPALSQYVEPDDRPTGEVLLAMFDVNPEGAIDQLIALADTQPRTVAWVLGELTTRTLTLTGDERRALENQIKLICEQLFNEGKYVALAYAVLTIKDRNANFGQNIENYVTGLGFAEQYLTEASPVAP